MPAENPFAPRKLSFRYVQHVQPETLLQFLVRRFRYHDAEQWRGLIEAGHVTVDGEPASGQARLRTKQAIVYIPPPVPEPPVDARYTILFQDQYLLAVSKSANIPTSPSGKYWHHCLRHVLQRELGLASLHAVHRLDRETSGVNVFAKTAAAARRLGDDFTHGRVRKVYSAILRGGLPAREIAVSAPLRDEGGAIHIKQAVHPLGRAAHTRFHLRAVLPGASLVDAVPLTGRTHQIRAHAAFLGHPVWGDRLYGAPEAEFIRWVSDPRRDLSERHLLHARLLTIVHPETGQTLTLEARDQNLVALYLAAK